MVHPAALIVANFFASFFLFLGTSSDENERVLFLRNLMGKTFVARNANDIPSPAKSGANDTSFSDIKTARYNPDSLHRLLKNICGLYQYDYWTYEWCHRYINNLIILIESSFPIIKRVRMSQFHLEPTEAGFVKAPNWSLGNYSRTIVVRENGDFLNESAPIYKVHIHLNI